jgi:hypothetical protein
MTKVTAQFTMSLDGFIAGPNDEIDKIFRWYFSGDTDFQGSSHDPKFKISRASAELLRQEWDKLGAIVTGRRGFGGLGWQPSPGRTCFYRDPYPSPGMAQE